MAPLASTRKRLEKVLSDPVSTSEVAELLHMSRTTVYESCRKFEAARRLRDEDAMRREIPCLHRGGVEQSDGTFKGGRYTIPRDLFILWYCSAGLDGEVIERLYGGVAS